MNPTLTLEFSSLHELLVISIKIRDSYRSLATDPIAEGCQDWARVCTEMANQMVANRGRGVRPVQHPDAGQAE